ncbi:SusD/RagB family nutrient-binding outer membrane lipoprotein [Tenacibaculum dicentrarchi]|uniref:SusD/RagB family nutrient-binding outer membrane lipoprotein n=1 Tax=Tenacibaculum dicentrarchi TaxID=669041 RepID=UPI00351628CC
MKVTKIFKGFIVLAVATFISCDDFGDININPNEPTTAQATYLLTNAIYTVGNQTTSGGFTYASILMQEQGKSDFNVIDQYKIDANNSLWITDNRLLGDMNDVLNEQKTNASMKAVAKIMKAFIGAQLTDLYGPIPFFEAGDKNNLTPKYDKQKDIYTASNGVLQLLSQAVGTLSKDKSSITGDVMFAGNKNAWIKFANVLRLRYLLRVSDKYPNAAAQINQIVASGDIFKSNVDNAILPFTSASNNWYLSTAREGDFKILNITTTILKMLTDREDPRISFYYKPNASNTYVGITPGSNDRSGNYTGLSDNLRASNVLDMVFASYFEQEFILSEAASKGFIDSSKAKLHYENAVKANFEYRNVEIPSDYLTATSKGAFKGTVENIITQKYLANIMSGYESWFDYRRTGFPVLTAAINNTNSDKIPVRFKYPSEETFTNKVNNIAALSWLGENNYNAKSWWDK